MRIVLERRMRIIRAWDDHFGDGGPI
jgi:hypothetical protein